MTDDNNDSSAKSSTAPTVGKHMHAQRWLERWAKLYSPCLARLVLHAAGERVLSEAELERHCAVLDEFLDELENATERW